MSLWTSSLISLLLLQPVQLQAQQTNEDANPAVSEERAGASAEQPQRLAFKKRDHDLTRAYFDVYTILSDENTCSSFYGGTRVATTVLNGFAPLVKQDTLIREVSFQMIGRPRLIRDEATGRFYRFFDRTMVNRHGSFYQRRTDPWQKFPADIGTFAPGSRQGRALILLHELGHLIQDENGAWLLPDDGHNGVRSKANTLRVQEACRTQLEALR
jgi:hypothetical protein